MIATGQNIYSINTTISMITESMKKSVAFFLVLSLGSGHVNAQESFPAYLPADSTSPANIWATYGHSAVISRRNMSKTGEAFVKTIDYYDSFGRKEETTMTAYELSGNDIVSYNEIDCFGRTTNNWLPTPVSQAAGAFVTKASYTPVGISFYGDAAPYSSMSYEASPLSRVISETGSGAAWRSVSKSVTTSYLTNKNDIDSLRCLKHSMGYVPFSQVLVELGEYYEPGSLSIESETDEDGHVTLTFTDRCGRLLLTRKAVSEGGIRTYHDTYYIYDQRDRLCAVLPPAIPKQTGFVNTQLMSKFAYQYQYDRRGRMSAKKLPGAGWIYIVYDDADRIVLSQDREMYAMGKSIFHSYDVIGRERLTGICSGHVTSEQANTGITGMSLCKYTGTGSLMGYSLSGMSLISPEIMKAQFYDSHSFIGDNEGLAYSPDQQYDSRGSCSRGFLTGTVTARISHSGITSYDSIAFYHDFRGRIIQKRETNVTGGHDVAMFSLGLNGEVITKRHDHTASGRMAISEITSCTYDGWGRLTQISHSVNGFAPVTLASYTYDAVGRIATKTLGGLETTSYTYNIRSWLTKISGQRFTERLCYNTAVEGLTPMLEHKYRWNGTVAAYGWLSGGEMRQRGYRLLYDGQGRLTAAHYGESNGLDAYHTKYDERAEYDCMGNPTWIYRKSPEVINDIRPSSPSDRLRLEYDGNHLVHVTDSVTSGHNYAGAFHFEDGAGETVEYEYDANGNMTKDLNRNISSIGYNYLNLPSMIQFGDNSLIDYTYSAAGEKLRTAYGVLMLPVLSPITAGSMETRENRDGVLTGDGGIVPGDDPSPPEPFYGTFRYYCGNVVYDMNATFLLTDEGYVTFASDGTPQYHYYLCDHMGNIRIVMDQAGAVEQVNHYYAFGSLMRESTNPGIQPYKYGGKELDRISGLDAYDFGARSYFSDRMQWSTMDPLCEKYYDVSPYVYCHNDPVRLIDLDGMDDLFDIYGNFITDTGFGRNVYILGQGKLALLSSFDYYEESNQAMLRKVASHYFGLSDYQLFQVSVDSDINNVENAALGYIKQDDKYIVCIRNGRINSALDDKYDFQSMADHERLHRYDPSTRGGGLGEVRAIIQQTKENSWAKTSNMYRQSQFMYAFKSLNMISETLTEQEKAFYYKQLSIAFNGATYNVSDNIMTGFLGIKLMVKGKLHK